MRSLRTTLHKATEAGAVLCVLAFLPAAYANSITAGFSLVNTNADGSVTTPSVLFPGDSSSFDLIGGNNGQAVADAIAMTDQALCALRYCNIALQRKQS